MPSGRVPTDAKAAVVSRVDWPTPKHVLDRVIATMGGIDLDPCSNAQAIVPALVRVMLDSPHKSPCCDLEPELDGTCIECGCATIRGDGLALEWAGRVYVNPPYGQKHNRAWCEKIASEAKRGCEIVALVPSSCGSKWWLPYRPKSGGGQSDGVCFYDRRITFHGASAPAAFDCAAVYYGPRPLSFRDAFATAGWVIL